MFGVGTVFCRRKYIVVIFMSCLTCTLFVFASERSHSTVFGANFQDVCRGNECWINDAIDVTSAHQNILPIHVIITFANAEHKRELQAKFVLTVSSLFQHSTRPVTLYIIGDTASQLLAKNILAERVTQPDKYKVRTSRVAFYNIIRKVVHSNKLNHSRTETTSAKVGP